MVLQNYAGSVASAYGPLTRMMPKAKKSSSLSQQAEDTKQQQKQKEIQSSLLEYTKRMDKIKQARLAITRSRDQGRLYGAAKQMKTKVVLPGLGDSDDSGALALSSNKFISQAQWHSANSVAQDVTQKNTEALPADAALKSSIFSSEMQKLSESSPNSFDRYWKVLNEGGQVRHIPVLKTPDGIVYSTVSRPAMINKPPEVDKQAGKRYGESDTKFVEVDNQGTTITKETFKRYHPGILPKPGMKGPYKSRVTLHVSLPQVENDHQNEYNDDDGDTDSCSIDLPNNSRASSRGDIPDIEKSVDKSRDGFDETHEKKNKNVESDDHKVAVEKVKSSEIQHGSSDDNKKNNNEPVSESTTQDKKKDNDKHPSGQKTSPNKGQIMQPIQTSKAASKTDQTDTHENHYPCAGCPACKLEEMAKISQNPKKSILKKEEIKPLPNIPSSQPKVKDFTRKNKQRRGSLKQISLPGGIVKLGKINYHRSYKINVHPVQSHMKAVVNGTEAGVTLHDSYEDAVNRTDVLKEAERTIQFEKLRKENQDRMKKLGSVYNKKDKMWQSLCRHGRFVNECYTCRAVEEIRQRLKQTYTKGEQQYQWNLLKKHERQLTQGIDPSAKSAKHTPSVLDSTTRFRRGSIANATDLADITSEDTHRPDGRPGGRVITGKDGGRANPQGMLPSAGSMVSSLAGGNTDHREESQDELSQSKRRVRFSEERIFDPMRGSYRKKSIHTDQVLLPPIENG